MNSGVKVTSTADKLKPEVDISEDDVYEPITGFEDNDINLSDWVLQ